MIGVRTHDLPLYTLTITLPMRYSFIDNHWIAKYILIRLILSLLFNLFQRLVISILFKSVDLATISILQEELKYGTMQRLIIWKIYCIFHGHNKLISNDMMKWCFILDQHAELDFHSASSQVYG
jgi:hypothetical protein